MAEELVHVERFDPTFDLGHRDVNLLARRL